MTREDWAKANSSEVKKLQKYNNLYDRLRKKRDELEILFAQRKFLNLVHEQITQPAYMLRSYDLLMASICEFPYGQELAAPAAVILKPPA